MSSKYNNFYVIVKNIMNIDYVKKDGILNLFKKCWFDLRE